MLRRLGLSLLCLLVVAACSSDDNPGGAEGTQMGFTNPVYDNNFADPHVIAVGSSTTPTRRTGHSATFRR